MLLEFLIQQEDYLLVEQITPAFTNAIEYIQYNQLANALILAIYLQ
jgi:hypothetical protein